MAALVPVLPKSGVSANIASSNHTSAIANRSDASTDDLTKEERWPNIPLTSMHAPVPEQARIEKLCSLIQVASNVVLATGVYWKKLF